MLWLLSAVIGNQAASQHIADARVPEHACGSNTLGGWGDMTQSRSAWHTVSILRRLLGRQGMQAACRATGREAGQGPGPGSGPGSDPVGGPDGPGRSAVRRSRTRPRPGRGVLRRAARARASPVST